MKKKILVTGGTGYIGSHTVTDLLASGFEVISIDNYARSSAKVLDGIEEITGVKIKNYNIDLCNFADTYQVFAENTDIEGIIHFAAYKSVPESVEFPMRYYENNLFSLINVLKCAEQFGVKNFVFSSSCSVYGNVDVLPVTEDTPLSKPECAYAATKQMGEQIILDFAKANGDYNHCVLRYFNPVGAHVTAAIGEMPVGKPNNLVPLITQTAAGLHEKMYVWGNDYDTRDGSCIRDYIHVMDIANAHTKALQFMMRNTHNSNCEIFNLGSGLGVSVLEAIRTFEKVSERQLNYELGPRREGDVIAVYANNEKAMQLLCWNTQYNLEDMMLTAWKWQLKCGE
ncbi:MAG: UDP-glucose 4-epimerase GalE [Chitinophagaceae bacterium]|nr:UDP-glucose 4-epimerase GalE [Chitinophagaceae bacterium]